MARTKGAVAKGVDNKAVRAFLLMHRSLAELPQIVEDCIWGAMGQEKESRGYSGERIVAILKQLDYIDTPTVFQQMWGYNISQGDESVPSKRNTERMTKVLRCASDAIYHHAILSRRSESTHQEIFNLTDDEREKVRAWVKSCEWCKVKELLTSCGKIKVHHQPPILEYTEDNLVRLATLMPIAIRPPISLPCPFNINESITDHQPENMFTVKGIKNLQPLIEEIGLHYACLRSAA
ncbi:hypothetical protein [Raoultella terrigena]|uniref:hypothetical protein n=1 Tax=Raoultella terrigena TaxID=577 RepID=UPI001330FC7A|nr:hypothetical protein [Raoultella terrigena]